jgi:hypothetical protein
MESSGLLTPQSASLVEEGKVAFIADLQQQWMKGGRSYRAVNYT